MNFLFNISNKISSFFKSSNNKNNEIQILSIKDNINPKPNLYKFKILLNKYFKYNLFYHWIQVCKNKNKKLLDYVTFNN